MRLRKISLKNFRNFSNRSFSLNPFITIIIGKNSVGKTNLLEAIYFISSTQGFREEKIEELIMYNEKMLEIEAFFFENNEEFKSRIVIEKKAYSNEKHIFINKLKRSLNFYLSQIPPIVIFSPSFLFLIDGEIEKRRKYFDKIISSFDREYKKKLINYESALKKRNKILEKEKDLQRLKDQLPFWDEYLINQATYLTKKREDLVIFYNQHQQIDHYFFNINYQKSDISKKRLEETFEKQLLHKKTIIGPQRDIYEFYLLKDNLKKNIHRFGSRSEQRLTLFWLILNQLKIYEKKLKKKPILLLDDIFSELDLDNQHLILKLIHQYQTIITTTQPEIINLINFPHSLITL